MSFFGRKNEQTERRRSRAGAGFGAAQDNEPSRYLAARRGGNPTLSVGDVNVSPVGVQITYFKIIEYNKYSMNYLKEKFIIKNRLGLDLAILMEKNQNQKGVVFVMHGLSGTKEQDHIVALAEAFFSKGFTVIRFDTTNTFGESGGKYEDATITSYYQDLEDVINWAEKQDWYQQPFILCGHSLGGICVSLYAEKFPEKVLALVPISPVVTGALTLEAHNRIDAKSLKDWEKTGWLIQTSQSRPGIIKKLPWSHMQDRLKYNLLPEAAKLTMPVLLVVGEKDTSTPPDHVKQLFDVLPGLKEFHIISNAPHTFREPEHLEKIKKVISNWLDKIII